MRSVTPASKLNMTQDSAGFKLSDQDKNSIMAISSPKKQKIGDIIESARNFVRVGDESGKP